MCVCVVVVSFAFVFVVCFVLLFSLCCVGVVLFAVCCFRVFVVCCVVVLFCVLVSSMCSLVPLGIRGSAAGSSHDEEPAYLQVVREAEAAAGSTTAPVHMHLRLPCTCIK